MNPGRAFVLAAACPQCGWRPAKRVYEAHVRAVATLHPDIPLDSIKCQRNDCGHIYNITAGAYQNARAA